MGLVVNTNIAAVNTARQLRRSTLGLRKSLERLSSGLRINRAADAAAGLSIAEGFNSQVRGFRVAQRNAQDGINLVQTAEGALSEISSIMQRIRELAVQAASGTLSVQNRTDLQLEATELSDSITEILGRTRFNDIDPFAAVTITIQSGADKDQNTTLAGTGTLLSVAQLIVGGVDISTQTGANTAIETIDDGLIVLNTRRSQFGAAQNRLEFTINVLAIREENALASESSIRDANIATETINFTRNQILVTAATSILAQANLVPQTALQLLG
ncbi:MAG: flagellin [Candidatus Hydrogenedentota bacterium]